MVDITQSVVDEITKDIKAVGGNIAALQDKTSREVKEMRDLIDETGRKTDALVEDRIGKFAASIETKTQAIETGFKDINAQIEKIDAVLKRPGAGWAGEEGAKDAEDAFRFHKAALANAGKLAVSTKIEPDREAYVEYCAAFPSYMRARSDGALSQRVQAALQTGSDPDGGYLVPTQVDSRIITKVYETSALRALAYVVSISGKELSIPRDEGEFGYGGWVGETTAPSETTTSQFGESKIVAHEMFAEPRATQSMLEDAGLDIEAWIANKVGEKMGRIEATAFFTGTGVNQPRGLLTYANGTTNGTIEQIASGNATNVTADGLYNLVFSLKDYYTPNSRFLMKRLTVRNFLKLKDGNGQYIWQMGDIKTGQPSTLLGYPVERAEDMPTLEAGSLSVAFGDFRAAYTIVDRLGITLLRDNLTAKPYVKFYNRRRVGGDVVNFEAVKLLVTAAS